MTYDAIIIGAGHNGLTAAGYLAGKGKSVLVLERRDVIGGAAPDNRIRPRGSAILNFPMLSACSMKP